MAEQKHIIEPERLGLWVAVTFILVLLSLVIGFVSLKRIFVTTAATQYEVVLLNQKIEDLRKTVAALSSAEHKGMMVVPQAAEGEKKAAK